MSPPEPTSFRLLTGLVPAAFTPFQADGSLDLAKIPAVVEHLLRHEVSGLYICGTTGEGPLLTQRERQQVAQAYVQAVAGRVPVVVQVGSNCLRDAQDLAEHAEQIGASAISATPPSYYPIHSLDLLVQTMQTIAGATQLPFYYYHIPMLTHVTLDMADFLQAANIPNLVGIKFSHPALSEFRACLDCGNGRYNMVFGSDEMYLAGLATGAHGAVGSTYNFAAPLYRSIRQAFESGDIAQAQQLQSRSVHLAKTLVRPFGIAGLKAMMSFQGIDCGPTRLPIRWPTSQELTQLRQAVAALGF